ncbi:MAG: AAA family ATPase [Pseudomonadota bacterium]
MSETPTFWLIAGPNGVGKTTYAFKNLKAVSGSINFVNMDEIARGLSPLDPEAGQTAAARVALQRARDFIAARQTFAMETTLSGKAHLSLAKAAIAAGMRFHLQYFIVPDPAICLARIARRVAEGGHHVPDDVVVRRFWRSYSNLKVYSEASDQWHVFEASSLPPKIVRSGHGSDVTYSDDERLGPLINRLEIDGED